MNMDSRDSWSSAMVEAADRNWNYEYNCHCGSGTGASTHSYSSGVFIIDSSCTKEKTESIPLSFTFNLKPSHDNNWTSVDSKNWDKGTSKVSSTVNQYSSDFETLISATLPANPKPLAEELYTLTQQLSSSDHSETDSTHSIDSRSASRRSSSSNPSNQHPRFLQRSNSYPLDRSQDCVKNRPLRNGNSCGQLVKTSYIPRQFQTCPQKDLVPSTARKVASRPRRMKERYISLGARILSLFTLGVIFAVVLNFLQKQKNVTVFSPGLFGDVLNCEWWMLPAFGIAAAVIGLLYPFMDQVMGNRKALTLEWSNVMRCIAVFVGINHVTARINFESNIHLAMTLAALSLGLWYFFDKSLLGLVLCFVGTGVATVITQLLVAAHVFGYSNPDFLYMRSWVPCLYFSGSITVGVVGRALAKLDSDYAAKEHLD